MLSKKPNRSLKEPVINYGKARGIFDGAFQGAPRQCVVDTLLFLEQYHHFLLKFAVEQNTSNITKFWTILNIVTCP